MAGDWIKLHRAITKSPIFEHDGLFRLWMYCLLRANWKPRKWLIPGTLQEVDVPRGAFVTGRQSLFESMYPRTNSDGNLIQREYAPAPITLWRWLKSLETMGCLQIATVNNRCSVVTICNYSTYQDVKESDEQVMNRSRSGGDQVVITIEEDQEFKKEEYTHTGTADGDRMTFRIGGRSEAFNRFIKAHPRPSSPGGAWEAWQAKRDAFVMETGRDGEEFDRIVIEATEAYRNSPAGQDPASGSDVRLSAGKWLLGNCWEEDRKLWLKPNGDAKKTRSTSAKKDLSKVEEYFASRGLGDAKT